MKTTSRLLLIALHFSLHSFALPTLFNRDASFENVRTRLDQSYQRQDVEDPHKYFHVSLFHPHYDGRFADKPLSYDSQRSHVTALIQTCVSQMNDFGVDIWLMHGSLLGWWWNRKSMPWNADVDMMVSEETINHLAYFQNMTIHHFYLPEFGEGRDYLLEINPHFAESEIDASNPIDARWIDTETGLFIDIITLRSNETAESLGDKENMFVKDGHGYRYNDIYPLRDSTFENVLAKVPYAYDSILRKEYGEQALWEALSVNKRFADYVD